MDIDSFAFYCSSASVFNLVCGLESCLKQHSRSASQLSIQPISGFRRSTPLKKHHPIQGVRKHQKEVPFPSTGAHLKSPIDKCALRLRQVHGDSGADGPCSATHQHQRQHQGAPRLQLCTFWPGRLPGCKRPPPARPPGRHVRGHPLPGLQLCWPIRCARACAECFGRAQDLTMWLALPLYRACCKPHCILLVSNAAATVEICHMSIARRVSEQESHGIKQ